MTADVDEVFQSCAFSCKPSFAVLLSAYNGVKWIEEQVYSILNQEGVDVELFVSVDRSNDGTEVWVDALSKIDSRVVMLPYGPRFGGAGPNFYRLIKDVDLEKFDGVAFADQDDIWIKDKLLRSWFFINEKGFSVVSTDVVAFWPNGKRTLIKKSFPQRKFDFFFEAAGPGCSYVFSKAAMTEFKCFIERKYEFLDAVELHDWLAYAYFRYNGFSWHIDNNPLVLYRQHDSNQMGSNSGFKAFFNRVSMFRNGWYRRQVESIAKLVAPDMADRVLTLRFMLRWANHLRRKPSERMFLIFMRLIGMF